MFLNYIAISPFVQTVMSTALNATSNTTAPLEASLTVWEALSTAPEHYLDNYINPAYSWLYEVNLQILKAIWAVFSTLGLVVPALSVVAFTVLLMTLIYGCFIIATLPIYLPVKWWYDWYLEYQDYRTPSSAEMEKIKNHADLERGKKKQNGDVNPAYNAASSLKEEKESDNLYPDCHSCAMERTFGCTISPRARLYSDQWPLDRNERENLCSAHKYHDIVPQTTPDEDD